MSEIRSVNDFPNYDKIFRKEKKKTDTEEMVTWICKGCENAEEYFGICEVTIPEYWGRPDACMFGGNEVNWQKKEENDEIFN